MYNPEKASAPETREVPKAYCGRCHNLVDGETMHDCTIPAEVCPECEVEQGHDASCSEVGAHWDPAEKPNDTLQLIGQFADCEIELRSELEKAQAQAAQLAEALREIQGKATPKRTHQWERDETPNYAQLLDAIAINAREALAAYEEGK